MTQFKHYAATLLLCISLLLTGCSDKSKLLLKTWMVENLKYSQEVPEAMKPQVDRSIEELRKSFRMTYYADGTYSTQNNDQVLKGKWKLNWNASTITSTPDKGEAKEFKIVELSENRFTFKAQEGGEEVTFELIPAK